MPQITKNPTTDTHSDPRHLKRLAVVQYLFSTTFDGAIAPGTDVSPDVKEMGDKVLAHATVLDAQIARYSPKFEMQEIAKSDLAILRLSIYELIVEPKEPPRVVINEAVELAKEIGNDRSYAYVNAVLGSVLEEYEQKKSDAPKEDASKN